MSIVEKAGGMFLGGQPTTSDRPAFDAGDLEAGAAQIGLEN